MSNDNTNTNPTPSDTAEEKEKRTRTSPRTKMLGEVLDMLDAYKGDVEARKGEPEPDTDEDFDTILNTVSDIRGRVEAMVGGQAPKPVYGGRHYIGVAADGTRSHFQANSQPTKLSFGPGTKHNFSSVLGPFRTEEGANYRVSHPEEQCPVLF
jgi:hypothetical protein